MRVAAPQPRACPVCHLCDARQPDQGRLAPPRLEGVSVAGGKRIWLVDWLVTEALVQRCAQCLMRTQLWPVRATDARKTVQDARQDICLLSARFAKVDRVSARSNTKIWPAIQKWPILYSPQKRRHLRHIRTKALQS